MADAPDYSDDYKDGKYTNGDPWNYSANSGGAKDSDDKVAEQDKANAAEDERRKAAGQPSLEQEHAQFRDEQSASNAMWGDAEANTPGFMGTGAYTVMGGYKIDPNSAKTKGFDQTEQELRTDANMARSRAAIQTNTGPQDQFRNKQMSLANMLMAQANGQGGMSVAQAQSQQASDRNLANALAMQASQRGAGQEGGLRQAADQRTAIGQQQAADSATLRLQEQQQAQQNLGNLLNSGRGQDLSLAGQQDQTALASRGQNDDLYKFDTAQSLAQLQADQQARQEHAKMLMQQDLEREKLRAQSYEAERQGEKEVMKSVMSMAGGAMGAASDKKLKTDIKSGDREVTAFLDALNAHSYRYKDSKHGEGRRVSPMAQEFQKSTLGRALVEKSKDGLRVDYGKGLGTMAAALASIHKRLKQIEEDR